MIKISRCHWTATEWQQWTCGPAAFTVNSSCRTLGSSYMLHCTMTSDPNATTGPFLPVQQPSPLLLLHCSSLQVGQRTSVERECDPSCRCRRRHRHRAIQDSRHVSHSSQNNCRVNEHTARHITSHRALWISSTAAGKAFMQSRLMLIISHSVIKGADGGTREDSPHWLGAKWGGRQGGGWLATRKKQNV